jgi:hypothetical protein
MSHKSKDIVADLLSLADVKINGNRPWDIQVHDDKLYSRVLIRKDFCFAGGCSSSGLDIFLRPDLIFL